MVFTCRKTVQHEKAYISKFKDEYGNVQKKELPRPTVAPLCEFLPLINEHNKARQNALAFEKCWLTKNCWTRLMFALLGMAIVDVQCWDGNKQYGYVKQMVIDEGDNEELVDDFNIKIIANLIGKPFMDGQFQYRIHA